jgi:hypothetical protein
VASRSHDLVLHAPSTFDYLGNVVWYFSWAVLLGSSDLKTFVLCLPILCSLLKCHDGLFCVFEFACVLQQQQEKGQPRQSVVPMHFEHQSMRMRSNRIPPTVHHIRAALGLLYMEYQIHTLRKCPRPSGKGCLVFSEVNVERRTVCLSSL